jgi:hypothetical protein
MTEGRGVALAILGIVALIAVVGLVMLFSGRMTAKVVAGDPIYGVDKLYGRPPGQQAIGSTDNPYSGSWVKGSYAPGAGGVMYGENIQPVKVIAGSQADYRVPAEQTKTCPRGLDYFGARQAMSLDDDEYGTCVDAFDGRGLCCDVSGLQVR